MARSDKTFSKSTVTAYNDLSMLTTFGKLIALNVKRSVLPAKQANIS